MHFVKMHGGGNDFIVVMAKPSDVVPDAAAIKRLADRRTGVGCDQLLWVTPGNGDGDAYYRIFNADGSEVEQCGNGARCVARAWADHSGRSGSLRLMSPAGPVIAELDTGGIRVSMGPPRRPARDLPATADSERPVVDVAALGKQWPLWLISMGNPHAVLLVDDVDTAPIDRLGAALQDHPAFPAGVNVGFLQCDANDRGRLRVFERGVGETAACGTGACAAHVAGVHAGRFAERTTLSLPGADLMVSWRGVGHPVWLGGPAEYVFHGAIDL